MEENEKPAFGEMSPEQRRRTRMPYEKAKALKGETVAKVEEETDARITPRMRKFCELYVEGIYSPRECAIRAGYAEATASTYAWRLSNGEYPQAVALIRELREQRERKYGVTTIGQLERLYHLSRGAEQANQFSAAINAEKLRSALGGLTVDRREQISRIEDMSKAQVIDRILELQAKYPFLAARDITPAQEDEIDGTGSETVEEPEDDSGQEGRALDSD